MRLTVTSALLLVSLISTAQDIKPLDFTAHYKSHKVKTRDCFEVKYKGNQVADSVHVGTEEFNSTGQLIKYTENFARGKKMAEYHYEYDAQGKISKSTVQLVFNNWQPIEFVLSYDAKGRLITRELPESIPNFWKKETYTYNASGVLVKSEQWFDQEGQLKSLSHHDYPPSLTPKENSLSYIYDPKGLLIIHQLYVNGKIESAKKFRYTHF